MENGIVEAVPEGRAAFFLLVNHPIKFKIYLLTTLPAAFFSGLKVLKAESRTCTVSVPYKRFTQNPFRSTYFACLSMAAEMTTGILAMANLYRRKPGVSMLITGMEARFHKKATGTTYFTCADGLEIQEAIAASIVTRQGQEVKVRSVGKNRAGEVVAEFWFTWSFKAK